MQENIEIVNERIETTLTTGDFFYDLPPELIAQTPAEKRDCSRLLALDRKSGTISHESFFNIKEHLRPEDILGALAFSAGLLPKAQPISARELAGEFSWEKVCPEDIYLDAKMVAKFI